jgi:YidC/Oxa1 family membrane protein insertase
VALVAWPFLFPSAQQPDGGKKTPEAQSGPSPAPETEKKSPADDTPKKTETAPAASVETSEKPLIKLDDAVIENDSVRITVDPVRGGVKNLTLKKFLDSSRKNEINLLKSSSLPLAMEPVFEGKWTVADAKVSQSSKDELSLTRKIKSGKAAVTVRQKWRLTGDYTVDYDIQTGNSETEPVSLPELSVFSGDTSGIQNLCGDEVRMDFFTVEYYLSQKKSLHTLKVDDTKDKDFTAAKTSASVEWVGVSNKYFAALLRVDGGFGAGAVPEREHVSPPDDKDGKNKFYLAGVSGVFPKHTLQPGETEKKSLRFFGGPKEMAELKKFTPEAADVMYLSFLPLWVPGSSLMELLAQWLLTGLVYLKSVSGSYGVAIILLTVIVRAVFWPITQKANNSMKKMQKIQPLVVKLREKHKDNPQMMNSKIMELYREQKVNPLGGCLPILLQIPVFLALYSTLDAAVELRQVSFWWAHDLCKPDTVAVIAGVPLNPLILVMTVLMFIQQKMTPSAMDPMQQKMMLAMPFVMLFFLYSLPSGLTLYWTVSQIISIIQLLINNRSAALDKKQEQAAAKA